MKQKVLSISDHALINHLLEHFNFVLANKVMKHLKWKWRNNRVPTIPEMQQTARELLEGLLLDAKKQPKDVPLVVSTGGFQATYYSKRLVDLTFSIAGSDSELFFT